MNLKYAVERKDPLHGIYGSMREYREKPYRWDFAAIRGDDTKGIQVAPPQDGSVKVLKSTDKWW